MRYLLLFICLFSITSCGDDYLIRNARNNVEVGKAALVPNGISPQEALQFIIDTNQKVADSCDHDKEIHPTTTYDLIVKAEGMRIEGQPNTELVKISEFVAKGPSGFGSVSWLSIAGFAAVGLGMLGKFMGPPFSVFGSALDLAAKRWLPQYEENKKAAVGTILATDQLLTQFDELITALDPETKAKLVAACGGDPLNWTKSILKNAQQDIGCHSQVSNMMTSLKTNLTTQNGDFAHTAQEVLKFVKKV